MRSPRLPCLGLKHASGSPCPPAPHKEDRGTWGKQLVDQQEAAPSAVFLSFLACHHSGRVAGSAPWFGNGMGARLAGWAGWQPGRGSWERSCLSSKSGESSLGTKQASYPDTVPIRAPVFGGLYLKLQLQGWQCQTPSWHETSSFIHCTGKNGTPLHTLHLAPWSCSRSLPEIASALYPGTEHAEYQVRRAEIMRARTLPALG